MRKFWLTVGWASGIGSVVDAMILLYAAYVVVSIAEYTWGLSSEMLFRLHLSWLYWVKQLAYLFMHEDLVHWIFNLPATAFFGTRIVASVVVGTWAFGKAEALRPHPSS